MVGFIDRPLVMSDGNEGTLLNCSTMQHGFIVQFGQKRNSDRHLQGLFSILFKNAFLYGGILN